MRRAWILVLGLLSTLPGGARERAAQYVVIGNPGTVPVRIERAVLADVFLKKAHEWPGGENARPVDLPAQSAVRDEFTREVLGRSIGAVRNYWAQVLFSGRDLPPPELSEAEVLKYVRSTRGAVGYVGVAQPLDDLTVVQVSE